MEETLTAAALGGGDVSGTLPIPEARELISHLVRPERLAAELPKLTGELAKVALGLSDVEVPGRDPQFADEAWRSHPIYRSLAQAYLALSGTIERLAQADGDDWQQAGRSRLLAEIVTGALSPANFVPTNPALVR